MHIFLLYLFSSSILLGSITKIGDKNKKNKPIHKKKVTTAIISEEPVNLRARYDRMPNKKTTPTYIKKIVPNLDFEGLSIPYATASEYKCGNNMEDITSRKDKNHNAYETL